MIKKAYEYFNNRDIDGVLSLMQPGVKWPNGWKGGYVNGHEAVKAYWQRQWKELDPKVTPVSINEKDDNKLEVEVHQLVKDLQGNVIADGIIKHIYFFESSLISGMELEPV